MIDVFRLPVVQRSESRRAQQIGEADDVGQWRAQFVANVMNEIVS